MIKKYKLAITVFSLVGLFVGAGYANAQALTWSANQTVDLSDPDVDLTIVSGSEATSMVVGTGSIQVVVPDGDIFTVTSSTNDIRFSGDTSAIVSSVCTDTTATATVTGGADGETITLTPTGNNCSSGGGGGGGGGGGSSKKATPATPAAPANVNAPADCLPGFLFSPSTGRNCNAAAPATPASPNPQGNAYAFGQVVVKMGTKGEACMAWQQFLNDKMNAGLVVDGWCGKLTIAAAKAWQASVGLTADGMLGPMSRTKAMMQ